MPASFRAQSGLVGEVGLAQRIDGLGRRDGASPFDHGIVQRRAPEMDDKAVRAAFGKGDSQRVSMMRVLIPASRSSGSA